MTDTSRDTVELLSERLQNDAEYILNMEEFVGSNDYSSGLMLQADEIIRALLSERDAARAEAGRLRDALVQINSNLGPVMVPSSVIEAIVFAALQQENGHE